MILISVIVFFINIHFLKIFGRWILLVIECELSKLLDVWNENNVEKIQSLENQNKQKNLKKKINKTYNEDR